MPTRVIASIGVVLCAAMTSFSIYLGVIEHIYAPSRTRAIPIATEGRQLDVGRAVVCLTVQPPHNTTTTSRTLHVHRVSCLAVSHSNH
jgi:hypothetical protein